MHNAAPERQTDTPRSCLEASSELAQLSLNVRYLLWVKGIPGDQWSRWLSQHAAIGLWTAGGITTGLASAAYSVDDDHLTRVAVALDCADSLETFKNTDLATQRVDILIENLRYLLGIEPCGGM